MEQEQRIEALRNNRIVFGKMDSDIRLEAKRIGHRNFLCYIGDDKWDDAQGFESWRTYKLKSDYMEQPAIIECEVKPYSNTLHWHNTDGDPVHGLDIALRQTDLVGFKSDGWLFGRLYKNKNNGLIESRIKAKSIDQYEVLPIDAVLFSK